MILGAGIAVAALATACQPGSLLPFAGNGSSGTAGDTGPAANATLVDPGSVAAIPTVGGFYVVDQSACVIRRVDAAKTITAVAGTGTCGTSGDDGPATAAQIAPTAADSGSFQSIAVTADGTLYFADAGSATIRRISGGTITTVGSAPGCLATGVVTGPDDHVYVNCGVGIARVESSGIITPVVIGAGDLISAFAVLTPTEFLVATGSGPAKDIVRLQGDGSGSTTSIPFYAYGGPINAMAVDASGTLYIASEGDARIARFSPDGATFDLIAGNGHPDPGDTALVGKANNLPLLPRGIALTPNHGLVFASGHVVYRLEDPAAAPAAEILPPEESTTTTSSSTTSSTTSTSVPNT